MSKITFLVSLLLSAALTAQITRNREVALKNWPAPLYWQPSRAEGDNALIRTPSPEATTPVGSLVFVAMTPCRVVDTRVSSGFPSPFGTPSLMSGVARSFPIQSSTLCTIPSTAQAYSFNVTVIPNPLGTAVGYLTVWPEGQTQPNAVTLDDYPTGDIRNNAAIVPAGTPNGGISAITNGPSDLVIDINGYFAPSTGITLAQGAVGAPSLSFSGDAGTGIFSSGTGTLNAATGGTLALTVGGNNTALGFGALANTTAGNNAALGQHALIANTTGCCNTAVGNNALPQNTSGGGNNALGDGAMFSNTTGQHNVAVGRLALASNSTTNSNTAIGNQALQSSTSDGNTAVGDSALFSFTGVPSIEGSCTGCNTAVGQYALQDTTTGAYNTAVGFEALEVATGTGNIALGFQAGSLINSGNNNIDIGSNGTSSDSGVISIGSVGAQTKFFAAGIGGVNVTGANVIVNSSGQLGVVVSARRFKEDIQDMADASSGLLRLRPVTFRYQKPYGDGSKPLDYGLIAEEVAEVYPDLVVRGADGQIETIQYQKLTPMLLNEVQKERRERSLQLQNQNETIQSLQAQVLALQKTLETLLAGQR